MCEICGGPHFTVKCPQYVGSSAHYYANSYWQIKQNGTKQEIDAWLKFDKEETERHVRSVVESLDRLEAEFAKTQGRHMYDISGNYLGYQTTSGELLVNVIEPGMVVLPIPHYMNIVCENNTSVSVDSMHDVNDSYDSLHLSCEDDALQESQVEPETTMDISVPPPVQQEEREENTGKFIIDFSCSNEEIDAQLAAYKRWKKEYPEEEEGKKEAEQPPSNPDIYEDDFYPTDPIWDMSDASEVGDDHILSWETEFGDELVNLPTLVDEELFDPVGDLSELEALLEGKPAMVIKKSQKVDTMVEDEEHYNWPGVLVINETLKSTKPREKARKIKGNDRSRKKVKRWFKERKEPLKFEHDQSFRYMSRIQFMPVKFLIVCEDRVELNGLDRVQIKEKPPD